MAIRIERTIDGWGQEDRGQRLHTSTRMVMGLVRTDGWTDGDDDDDDFMTML